MSDTLAIKLPKGTWTDVAGLALNGLITNTTDHDVRLIQLRTVPDDTNSNGHTLLPGASIKFNRVLTDNVYARPLIGNGVLAVTYGNALSTDYFTRDFYLEVARNNMPGFTPVNIVGHDSAVGTSLATVGNNTGTIQEYSTTSAIDSISSDNSADTHTLTIRGLDSDFIEVAPQTVQLAGQTRVALPTPLMRVQSIVNSSSIATLGSIWVYENTAISSGVPTDVTKIRASMHRTNAPSGTSVSFERSAQSIYTVPAGKEAYIVFGKTTVSDNKALGLSFWGRPVGEVFKMHHHIDIIGNNYDYFFKLPLRIPAKTDIEVRAFVAAQTAEVSVAYDLILVDTL